MKIAIMICKDVTQICTGAGCMKAFHLRSGAFEQYESKPLTLSAFTTCLGCTDDRQGLMLRLASLREIGVEKIHLGICMSDKYCKYSAELFNTIRDYGFAVEMGTHSE